MLLEGEISSLLRDLHEIFGGVDQSPYLRQLRGYDCWLVAFCETDLELHQLTAIRGHVERV